MEKTQLNYEINGQLYSWNVHMYFCVFFQHYIFMDSYTRNKDSCVVFYKNVNINVVFFI